LGIARPSSNDNSTIMTSPRRCNRLARSKIMLHRNIVFGTLFQTKLDTCLFSVNSIECEIRHVHYLWERARECADDNPIMLVQTLCRLGHVRAGAGGCEGRNIFSFDVAEFRFWLNLSLSGSSMKRATTAYGQCRQGGANRAVSLCGQFRPRQT
jgi:hypothetical protein